LPGCEGGGNAGEICKEYQYVNGDYNGLNSFYYDQSGSMLLSKVTQSRSGSKEGSVFYSYNLVSELTGVEYLNSLSNVVRVEAYEYNSSGSLIEEINSVDFDQKKSYSYADGLLQSVEYTIANVLTARDSFDYYSNTTDLHRTIKYVDGKISKVIYNEWFGTTVQKESSFDATGAKLGSIVSRYNGVGVLIEVIEYTAVNSVKVKTIYVHEEDNLTEILKEDGQGNEFEKLVYQRF
jgi:hypothetical protein